MRISENYNIINMTYHLAPCFSSDPPEHHPEHWLRVGGAVCQCWGSLLRLGDQLWGQDYTAH